MEDELIHEQCAAYALDALGPDDERAFESHLATCRRCQDELAGLTATAASLAYAVPAAEPSQELRGRILAAARAERPNVTPLRPRLSSRRLALTAVAVAASCAAVGLGVWAATLHARLRSSDRALNAVPLRDGSGSLVLAANGQATLIVSGLKPAPAGKTYEAWVISGAKAAPAGLFSGRKETAIVRLTRRVPRGAIVGVTLERAGGAAAPTGTPFVTSSPVS